MSVSPPATACDGHGLCAELFAEWIELDDWGYPIINPAAVPPGLEAHGRRAIKECPKVALRPEAERANDPVAR